MTKFLIGFFSFGWLRGLDFLAPLLLRFFLAPIFWVEGSRRLGLFAASDFVWYDPRTWINVDTYKQSAETLASNAQGLIPMPDMMNGVIGGLEIVGAFFLIIGFAVRWISLPLMALVAIMGIAAVAIQTDIITTGKELLMSHGYTTMLNSGFESALALFLMLLALFFMGAGRFFSLDWFIHHRYFRKLTRQQEAATSEALDDPFDVDMSDDNDNVIHDSHDKHKV
jgi:uncharacterized membrane protein YphA (DoxX/SURF4 family)